MLTLAFDKTAKDKTAKGFKVEAMHDLLKKQVQQQVESFIEPSLKRSLAELSMVKEVQVDEGHVLVNLDYHFPSKRLQQDLSKQLEKYLQDTLPSASLSKVSVTSTNREVLAGKTQGELASVAGVKNIIAVASGKGGVGKSTTAVNLALAMASEGASVGILDADIYGPSQAMMLGVADGTRPDTVDEKLLLPIEAHGVKSMSMGYLASERTPMVWRGPMVSGALQQLLTQTRWGDLDYLIVDMPPGTGDIQLTLSQRVPVVGSVIVTTPQDIALLDAKKGIEMFAKVHIPVLGIIENMSVHICSKCGHHEALFGEGGGQQVAEDYDVPLLAQLPLDLSIRQQADGGCPSVVADPESSVARAYLNAARQLMLNLAYPKDDQQPNIPSIEIADD